MIANTLVDEWTPINFNRFKCNFRSARIKVLGPIMLPSLHKTRILSAFGVLYELLMIYEGCPESIRAF